jgi:hypothetical protein
MSTNLKVLALASAAMLAIPAAGHAQASLNIVEYDVGEWLVQASNFTTFSFNAVSVGSPFTSPEFGPSGSVTLAGNWADITDPAGPGTSGKAFVVASATTPTVIAELTYATTFTGATGSINATLYLSSFPDATATGPNIVDQGGLGTFTVAADGTSITTNTEGVPEPASMALFGTGLLGLGTILHRRRTSAGSASGTPQSDGLEIEALTS